MRIAGEQLRSVGFVARGRQDVRETINMVESVYAPCAVDGGSIVEVDRIAFVVTVMLTAQSFLRGQLRACREAGYDVHVIADGGPELYEVGKAEGVNVHPISMMRKPSLIKDLRSLWRIAWVLREIGPDIVNYGTPKAGLLGAIAAFVLRVPARVYVMRGLPLETTNGVRRMVLASLERVAALLSHRVICISDSLRTEAVGLRLFRYEKSLVIGAGSSNGVSPERYPWRDVDKDTAKMGIGLDAGDFVCGFLGRLAPDKGTEDLRGLVPWLVTESRRCRLLLLGPRDGAEIPGTGVEESVVTWVGWQEDPSKYLAAMDLLLVPSRREGFGNAIIEAGLHSTPAVGYDVTGVRDAVLNDVTGVLVPPFDLDAFRLVVTGLLRDPGRLQEMGRRARARAEASFAPPRIWAYYLDTYRGIRSAKSPS